MEKQPRALVVDDDQSWLETLSEELEDHDYIVNRAASREEAEHLLRKHNYDVVVMDINLTDAPSDDQNEPLDKQGMELIQSMRRYAKKKDLAVVIVTGYGTPNIIREAFKKLGVEDILPKQDFKLDEFRAIVEKATANTYLRMAGEQDETLLNVD
jgi:CheY-like chemotaxis protein